MKELRQLEIERLKSQLAECEKALEPVKSSSFLDLELRRIIRRLKFQLVELGDEETIREGRFVIPKSVRDDV